MSRPPTAVAVGVHIVHPDLRALISTAHQAVETTGRLIERLLPKHIHAVTAAGFEFKVGLFILACGLNFVLNP